MLRYIADFPEVEIAGVLGISRSTVSSTLGDAHRRLGQIAREHAQAGMRHQRLRVELRLNGELHARYQQRYLNIAECGARLSTPEPVRKPVRKDHNAGGKSTWMQGFFDRPSPPLWKAIGE